VATDLVIRYDAPCHDRRLAEEWHRVVVRAPPGPSFRPDLRMNACRRLRWSAKRRGDKRRESLPPKVEGEDCKTSWILVRQERSSGSPPLLERTTSLTRRPASARRLTLLRECLKVSTDVASALKAPVVIARMVGREVNGGFTDLDRVLSEVLIETRTSSRLSVC
jgi:hypothetical protein